MPTLTAFFDSQTKGWEFPVLEYKPEVRMTTVAEKWAEVLRGIGVRHVFGIPSGPWVEYMGILGGTK